MTQEDQKAFDDLFDTFTSKGWQLIVEEAQIEYDNLLKVLAVVKDTATIFETQGKLAVLNKMINFRELTQATYDQMIAEDEAEKELADADV